MNQDSSIIIPVKSLSTQVAVEKRLSMLHKAEEQLKTKKEILKDSLLSDEELVSLEDKKKEASQRLSSQKSALLNEPENRKLTADIKDLQIEVKDTKKLLGDELIGYFMESNSLEFVTSKGHKVRYNVNASFSKKDQLSLFE